MTSPEWLITHWHSDEHISESMFAAVYEKLSQSPNQTEPCHLDRNSIVTESVDTRSCFSLFHFRLDHGLHRLCWLLRVCSDCWCCSPLLLQHSCEIRMVSKLQDINTFCYSWSLLMSWWQSTRTPLTSAPAWTPWSCPSTACTWSPPSSSSVWGNGSLSPSTFLS